MNSQDSLNKMVAGIKELPTLPSVIQKINQLLLNPRTSANEIGTAIASDQAIASKVIRLVNSAFYGFPGRINTITHAIVILGFSTVKNIVLTTSILSALQSKKGPAGFDLLQFWRHSVATGAMARLLARETGSRAQEETFICGLLHDLGKLILALYREDMFGVVWNRASARGELFYDAELSLHGVSHCQLGGWLAEQWHLPADIESVLLHHHTPAKAGPHSLINAYVHIGDILARALEIGNPGDDSIPLVDETAVKMVGLDRKLLSRILPQAFGEIERASIFLTVHE